MGGGTKCEEVWEGGGGLKLSKKVWDHIWTPPNQKLRGHNFKIIKQRANKSKYANFFTNRIVNRWNKLPSEIVNAKSINNFKNLFDDFNKHIQYTTDIKEDWIQTIIDTYNTMIIITHIFLFKYSTNTKPTNHLLSLLTPITSKCVFCNYS